MKSFNWFDGGDASASCIISELWIEYEIIKEETGPEKKIKTSYEAYQLGHSNSNFIGNFKTMEIAKEACVYHLENQIKKLQEK